MGKHLIRAGSQRDRVQQRQIHMPYRVACAWTQNMPHSGSKLKAKSHLRGIQPGYTGSPSPFTVKFSLTLVVT